MNATSVFRSLAIGLWLGVVAGCAIYLPEQEDDVIAPTAVLATPSPTSLPSPLSTRTSVSATNTPQPRATAAVIASTIVRETANPSPTASPSITVTPFTVRFLTPTDEWQPVAVAEHIIFEIPFDWQYEYPSDGYGSAINGAMFVGADLAVLSDVAFAEGWGRIEYYEASPERRSGDWMETTIDSFPATYGIYVDGAAGFGEPNVYPLWLAWLDVYTAQRRHSVNLRCNAPNGTVG